MNNFAAVVSYAGDISLAQWFRINLSLSIIRSICLCVCVCVCVKISKGSIIINITAATSAKKMRKWPPHKSHILLSEMSLVCCRNELPVIWDPTIWCGTRSLGNFIFSLMRSLSFWVIRLHKLLGDWSLDAYFIVESNIPGLWIFTQIFRNWMTLSKFTFLFKL